MENCKILFEAGKKFFNETFNMNTDFYFQKISDNEIKIRTLFENSGSFIIAKYDNKSNTIDMVLTSICYDFDYNDNSYSEKIIEKKKSVNFLYIRKKI